MDAEQQRAEFDKIVARASRAGLLKFHQDGIAVLEIPPSPPSAPPSTPAADALLSSNG